MHCAHRASSLVLRPVIRKRRLKMASIPISVRWPSNGTYHIETSALSNMGWSVKTDDGSSNLGQFPFRKELLIGEVGAEHQPRPAVHHGVVAGGEAEQGGHADVEGIVVLDELFAAHRLNDRCLQRVRQWCRGTAGTCGSDAGDGEADSSDLARRLLQCHTSPLNTLLNPPIHQR